MIRQLAYVLHTDGPVVKPYLMTCQIFVQLLGRIFKTRFFFLPSTRHNTQLITHAHARAGHARSCQARSSVCIQLFILKSSTNPQSQTDTNTTRPFRNTRRFVQSYTERAIL